MATIGPMIAASAHRGIAYAERLLVGIAPAEFGSFARPGGHVIESNHPAFICGHLSIYPTRIMEELGLDSSAIAPTPKFEELFSHLSKCIDDPSGEIYPAMSEIVAKFLTAYRVATTAIETSPDEAFTSVNANEKMRGNFPTAGAMHAFYVGGHFMMHMGQLSAWRRAMGMPAA